MNTEVNNLGEDYSPPPEVVSKSNSSLSSLSSTHADQSSIRDWIEALVFSLLCVFILRVFVAEPYHIPSASMEDTLLPGDFILVNKFVYGAQIPFSSWKLPPLRQIKVGDVLIFRYPRDPSINFVKRCVACPGDWVEIKEREVFVNNQFQAYPLGSKFIGEKLSVHMKEESIFPSNSGFNKDYFGPVYVPKSGEEISLHPETLSLYRFLLEYEGHQVSVMGNAVYLDGFPEPTYKVKNNYYFVMGDNRDNSRDSRYWGFVPEPYVKGAAIMVFWSWNPDLTFFNPIEKINSIRWDRVGLLIH
ncbi:MAG: signal peptidase I [Chloroherpetonaceae bacterium]|nr:signal peptidase I [Chloroherpetonaceae bacterium]